MSLEPKTGTPEKVLFVGLHEECEEWAANQFLESPTDPATLIFNLVLGDEPYHWVIANQDLPEFEAEGYYLTETIDLEYAAAFIVDNPTLFGGLPNNGDLLI